MWQELIWFVGVKWIFLSAMSQIKNVAFKRFTKCSFRKTIKNAYLNGMFAKNERGYVYVEKTFDGDCY